VRPVCSARCAPLTLLETCWSLFGGVQTDTVVSLLRQPATHRNATHQKRCAPVRLSECPPRIVPTPHIVVGGTQLVSCSLPLVLCACIGWSQQVGQHQAQETTYGVMWCGVVRGVAVQCSVWYVVLLCGGRTTAGLSLTAFSAVSVSLVDNDAARQRLFGKLSRSILSAARRGGAGGTNLELALRVSKAREANMPKKTIDSLIKRVKAKLRT
jgi:TACO1/YebC protein N-terminal domain